MEQLGVKVDEKQLSFGDLERWAIFIHESMSISSRNYHSVKHVFDLADGWDNPIGVLSAYFHDCIYYQVDGGLSPPQQTVLHDVLLVKDGKTFLCKQKDAKDDVLLRMVEGLFGFEPGQEMLAFKGLNEFLSAVTAVRQLEKVLDLQTLTQIATCIEATIPFRPDTPQGQSPMDLLHERLERTNQLLGIGLTAPQCVHAVQVAAHLSNRDVGNFGSEDRAYFLDNTWSLLPETNEALRHQYLYTVKEFQHAVYKMNGFFNFLDPNLIFTNFQGVPSNETVETLTAQARRNMEVGRKYVGAKLLSVSVLAAFAELTGGDAPMSLFMGDLPSRHHVSYRLEDDLPEPPAGLEGCDADVYNILAFGRRSETAFDIRQSPLAAYLYGCMGDDFEKCLKQIDVYPMTKEKARDFLNIMPEEIISRVAENMAKVAVSRADLIEDVVDTLGVVQQD